MHSMKALMEQARGSCVKGSLSLIQINYLNAVPSKQLPFTWKQVYARSISLRESCPKHEATLYVRASLRTQHLFAWDLSQARIYSLRESKFMEAGTLYIKVS